LERREIPGRQNSLQEVDQRLNAVSIGAQKQHSGVLARRVRTHVSKTLVSGYEEAALALHRLPQGCIGPAAHALVRHRPRFRITGLDEQRRDSPRQVLVYLDVHTGA
jgi:hypothetical protein